MYRVFESLDALVTVVEEARGVPMTSNCVVPRGEVLELLDDVREALPGELDDAQDVLDRRDELVDDAAQEAEQTRSGAQADAEQLLAEAREEAERLRGRGPRRGRADRRHGPGTRPSAPWPRAAGSTPSSPTGPQAEAERIGEAGRAAHDRFVADGQAEQNRLVAQTEVVRAAHAEAARLVDAADAETDRLRQECDAYVDTKLAEFEDTLGKALRTVSRGRSQLWRGTPAGVAPTAGPAPGWT